MASSQVSFDRVAHRYDETRGLPADQMDPILDVLEKELADDRLVLEVGVGTGRFGWPLQARGVPLIGVDIAPRMLAQGREKGLKDVLLATALHLPFPPRTFDAVLSIHVLHLISDWRAALQEVARVSRRALYTVATYWDMAEGPYAVYRETIESLGHSWGPRGLPERELPDTVPPSHRVVIGTFQQEVELKEEIRRLDERVMSGQWDLPDEVHTEAMEAVRQAFGGEAAMRREKEIQVLRWDMPALQGL